MGPTSLPEPRGSSSAYQAPLRSQMLPRRRVEFTVIPGPFCEPFLPNTRPPYPHSLCCDPRHSGFHAAYMPDGAVWPPTSGSLAFVP